LLIISLLYVQTVYSVNWLDSTNCVHIWK